MKCDTNAYSKLENVLKLAFREKGETKPSEQWQQNVMSHIQNLGPFHGHTNYFELFEKFVWRFAPIACVLIFMLTFCIMNLDFIPEYEIARLFEENPIEFSYIEIFGV